MCPNHAEQSALTLSICIPTYNRASFLGATLDSMLPQLTEACEIVIVDGGSTDDTHRVASEYARRFSSVRYIRQEENGGFDRDCDRAVELARGEYCWLMTDDDLLKQDAVSTVLDACNQDTSLIIVNTEQRNLDMSRILRSRTLQFDTDRVYGLGELDRLFAEVGEFLMYVGCIVIRRSIWLQRERQRYYGTSFIFVGVIFQEPLPGKARVLATPLISYRRANTHSWTTRLVEIVGFSWPSLVSSLALQESTKAPICRSELWRDPLTLLLWRGLGSYSFAEYHRWIRPRARTKRTTVVPLLVALLPGVVVNTVLVLYFSVTDRPYRRWSADVLMEELRVSRFHFRNWLNFRSQS